MMGKLNFTLSACPKGVGRAATQPLIQRAAVEPYSTIHGKSNKFSWTPAMAAMLIFFKALFSNIPPWNFAFGRMSGANSSSIPIHVKTLSGAV